jgi:Protein of unknown function (DUF3352)
MNLRPLFALLLTIVLLLGGGLGMADPGLALSWGLGSPRIGNLGQTAADANLMPTTTSFMPRQAPLLFSLQVKPDRLLSGQPRRRRQTLERLGRQVLTHNSFVRPGLDLTYAKDLAPWIGDALSLAVTTRDFDRDATNGEQPGYLLAIETTDVTATQAAVAKLWQGRTPSIDRDQGAEIQVGDDLATAIVGRRFLLVANGPKVLREALANAQVPELNLTQAADYQASLAGLSLPRSALVYANRAEAQTWLDRLGIVLPPSVDRYRAIALGLGLNSQGVLADLGLLAQELPVSAVGPGPKTPGALAYIPDGATVVVSGRNLAGDPSLPLAQIERAIGLGDGSLNWIRGDYALAQLGRDWVLVVDRQEPTAIAGLQQLDRQAQSQGYSLENLNLGSQDVTAWTKLNRSLASQAALQTEVRGIHSHFGSFEVLTSSLPMLESIVQREAMGKTRDLHLGDRPLTQVSRILPTDNRGYLYLDWRANRDRIAQRVPLLNWIELTAEPLFSRLESLVVSPYSDRDRVQRAAVLLQLSDAS